MHTAHACTPHTPAHACARLRTCAVEQVFSTNITKDRETSFDHPNLPAIVNPFNTHNKMAYNPGVKLSYYLGAKQWDLVHLVYPSNIGVSVLPVCAWRRIPVYCSHHVDMEYYIDKYMHFELFAWFGAFLYWTLVKLPAVRLANVNAAPTLTFLDAHLPPTDAMARKGEGRKGPELRRRIPSGVAAARFKVDDPAQLAEERRELLRTAGADPSGDPSGGACVWLMVHPLAPNPNPHPNPNPGPNPNPNPSPNPNPNPNPNQVLGQSLYVRANVGVNSRLIKAIRLILERPG
jgi:hypothetical protein